MWQIILKLVGALIILGGVVMIYDARLITKKYFGFGDKNEATTGLKMLGTIVSAIGGIIVLCVGV